MANVQILKAHSQMLSNQYCPDKNSIVDLLACRLEWDT